MKQLAMLALSAALFVGCGKVEEAEAPTPVRDSDVSIESLKAANVFAYRFLQPGDAEPEFLSEPISLITSAGEFDLHALRTMKAAEATLTPDQVGRLVDAVYGTHKKTGAAACYDPRHVFLFYDDAGSLIRVIEVCFSCTNLHTQPRIQESQWWRHDFRELARICDEAGIGMASGTAEEFIKILDEQDEL